MIRCIVYSSAWHETLTPPAVQQMVDQAAAKNRQLGITGRLVAEANSFVQVIEGTRSTIGALYSAIEADVRHTRVLCLLDREFEVPSYRDWHALLPQAGEQFRTEFSSNLSGPVASADFGIAMRDDSIAALSQTTNGASLLERLRIIPRQQRASQTVDQIFVASEHAIKQDGFAGFSLDRAARDANVSLQAADRYFTSTDSLLRALCRRRQVIGFNAALEEIAGMTFHSEQEIADWVVDGLILRLLRTSSIHPPTFRLLFRSYHEVFHEGLYGLAEALLAALARSGADCTHLSAEQMTLALSGFGASTKTAYLRDPALLESPAVRASLRGGILGTLGVTGAGRPG